MDLHSASQPGTPHSSSDQNTAHRAAAECSMQFRRQSANGDPGAEPAEMRPASPDHRTHRPSGKSPARRSQETPSRAPLPPGTFHGCPPSLPAKDWGNCRRVAVLRCRNYALVGAACRRSDAATAGTSRSTETGVAAPCTPRRSHAARACASPPRTHPTPRLTPPPSGRWPEPLAASACRAASHVSACSDAGSVAAAGRTASAAFAERSRS